MSTTVSTWTALVTPFHADGHVDKESLLRLMERQERAGNGMLLFGSTGEGLSLSEEERLDILRIVFQRSWSVPILAGVGGMQLKEQCRWLELCRGYPLYGYLLTTPIYLRPGVRGQMHWFKELLDGVDRPCMLYNIPHRAGCQLSVEAVSALRGHPHFWAIKEGSGAVEQLRAYRAAVPDVSLYCGTDTQVISYLQEGASGAVAVMSNAWPEATHLLVSRLLSGREVDSKSWEVASRAANVNNPVSIKALLALQGHLVDATVRPPLSEEDIGHHCELRACDASIEVWLRSHVERSHSFLH